MSMLRAANKQNYSLLEEIVVKTSPMQQSGESSF